MTNTPMTLSPSFQSGGIAAIISNRPDAPASSDTSLYLTPDALMTYCQSRLQSIDGQVSSYMAGEQLRNDEKSDLQSLITELQKHGSEVVSDPAACGQMENAVGAEIDKLEQTDSGCPAIAKLKNMYTDMQTSGTLGDSTFSASEVTRYTDTVQGCITDLNSNSELDMIKIQSLMSQRQTAVQLTTNLVQSLDDQANKIAANIGH